jgi:radical SAM enzyme (TIGR01210 family)
MTRPIPRFSTSEILRARPFKRAADPWRPYAYFVEEERTAAGSIEPMATLFLTNRECPFHCLMCDLWQHTTDATVPLGAIPAQIDFALSQLPPARHVKLYNSGNFFDAQAIPPEDHPAIARQVKDFATVIVENHPKLCTDACLAFRDRLENEFEVAMGLETVHPQSLAALNKQMTVADFNQAACFLTRNGISVRAFLLLQLPGMSEEESVEWAVRSIEQAFAAGARCCAVIPMRAGNGIMDKLASTGDFTPPRLIALETVMEAGMQLGGGRVFVDLWDLERLFRCERCGPARSARLAEMNRSQVVSPRVRCDCGT